VLATVAGFAALQFVFVTRPALAAGYAFWLALGAAAGATAVLVLLARRAFVPFQAHAVFFRTAGGPDRRLRAPGRLDPFGRLAALDPLLVKNAVRLWRERSPAAVVQTAVLAALVYLVATNNADPGDRARILLFFALVYAFLFALRQVERFTAEGEPPELLYALPVGRLRLYLAGLVPAAGVLAAVVAVLAAFVLASGGGAAAAVSFAGRAAGGGLVFLVLAANAGLSRYADPAGARARYLAWALTLVVLASVFYPFRAFVVPPLVLLSFVPLRPLRLYREC
jgi:hypothetical protein